VPAVTGPLIPAGDAGSPVNYVVTNIAGLWPLKVDPRGSGEPWPPGLTKAIGLPTPLARQSPVCIAEWPLTGLEHAWVSGDHYEDVCSDLNACADAHDVCGRCHHVAPATGPQAWKTEGSPHRDLESPCAVDREARATSGEPGTLVSHPGADRSRPGPLGAWFQFWSRSARFTDVQTAANHRA
jgi:hypothetical protein